MYGVCSGNLMHFKMSCVRIHPLGIMPEKVVSDRKKNDFNFVFVHIFLLNCKKKNNHWLFIYAMVQRSVPNYCS